MPNSALSEIISNHQALAYRDDVLPDHAPTSYLRAINSDIRSILHKVDPSTASILTKKEFATLSILFGASERKLIKINDDLRPFVRKLKEQKQMEDAVRSLENAMSEAVGKVASSDSPPIFRLKRLTAAYIKTQSKPLKIVKKIKAKK